jgi:hypothetical protein
MNISKKKWNSSVGGGSRENSNPAAFPYAQI